MSKQNQSLRMTNDLKSNALKDAFAVLQIPLVILMGILLYVLYQSQKA